MIRAHSAEADFDHCEGVFQEIALATAATIVVGQTSMDWEFFRLALYWIWFKISDINQLPGAPNIENPAKNCIEGLLEFSDRSSNVSIQLLPALSRTRSSLCYDGRDRIFAIRGLLDAFERLLVTPDYTLSVEEVYKATTVAWIKQYERLDILKIAMLQSSSSNFKMPSWVPDFSCQNSPDKIDYASVDGSSRATFIFDGDTLSVHGVRVAEIRKVGSSGSIKRSTDEELIHACRSWVKQVSLSEAYVAGGAMEDAFIEAIMCGRTKENAPANAGRTPSTQDCRDVLLATERLDGDRQDSTSDVADREVVLACFRRSAIGRAFFQTIEGYIGMCPESAKTGDIVVVMLGCRSPLILRPEPGNRAAFKVVGECYVSLISMSSILWLRRLFSLLCRCLLSVGDHSQRDFWAA